MAGKAKDTGNSTVTGGRSRGKSPSNSSRGTSNGGKSTSTSSFSSSGKPGTSSTEQSPSTGKVSRANKGPSTNNIVRKPIPSTSFAKQSLACSYLHRICMQNRLEGYEYCIRHILNDRNAPFRQCSYTHPQNGKRCPNAARKADRKESTLCPWHIKKMFLKKKQQEMMLQMKALSRGDHLSASASHAQSSSTTTSSSPRKKPSTLPSPSQQQEGLPKLLRDLEHYCTNDHIKKRRGDFWEKKQEDETTTASDDLRARITEAAIQIANESDDDPLVENTMTTDLIDSDSESIDSDQQDPLGHAGVYTAEEVSLILSEKMHRLQNLYIEQFKHLKYLLREKYRKYCLDALMDKDRVVSEAPSAEDTARLQAMKKYHRYQGTEFLLKKKAKEKRRALSEGKNYQPVKYPTCIFEKDGQKCSNRSLPATHYCFTHILYDVHQVLFRPCASGTTPCLNPVVSFQHNNACILHRDLKTDQTQARKIIGQEHEEERLGASNQEPELFQSIDDISSLALDAEVPSSIFSLEPFPDLGAAADLLP